MVDLIATANPALRAAQVAALGVDIVCVHTAFDVQAHADPLMELREVKAMVGDGVALACAGGIKDDGVCMEALMLERPDIVVVGGYIGNAGCKPTANGNIRQHFVSSATTAGANLRGAAQPETLEATGVLSTIVKELGVSTSAVCPVAVNDLVSQLGDAENVFVCGMGRSGFAMRGFTMRLYVHAVNLPLLY